MDIPSLWPNQGRNNPLARERIGPLLLLGLAFTMTIFYIGLPTMAGRSRATAFTPKRSSSAIALEPDSQTLLVVNPDSNSLTLVNGTSLAVMDEIVVGIDPRTVTVDQVGKRAYVANRGSNTISVIDLVGRVVIGEISLGNRPYGILASPDGEVLYASEQGSNQLAVIDTRSLTVAATIPVADRPSGLALSDDAQTLYVTHLLRNIITVITFHDQFIYLPFLGYQFPDESLPEKPGQEPPISGQISPYDVQEITLWPDSNLLQSIVLSPDGDTAYVPHTRSNSANRFLTFDTTVFPLVSLIDTQTKTHLLGQQLDLGTLDPPGVGLPFDAAVSQDGKELWVLNAASNDLTVIDLDTRQRVAHIEVGDNPRGIALSRDGATAYVNNTLSGTVSVVDTASYTLTDTIIATQIPLPPVLLQGKRLFYSSDDPRMANAQWVSCNTCHFDGEHDGRTWFFGFAGPRNTTSLLGMVETYPLRWSGEWNESADAEFANQKENFGRGLLQGEMNCSLAPPDCVNHPPNQGRSLDLDTLAAFIDALPMPLSPGHAHGEPLSAAEQRGMAIFNDPTYGCLTCHPAPLYTDLEKHDVGTATEDERIGPAYDTPSLRGLYGSGPYFHDGGAVTLYEALTYPTPGDEHDLRPLLSEAQIQDLIAFLLALPYTK